MKKFLSRLFPSEVYYVNTSLTSHELIRVFMAKCCRPATSKLVMRFFFRISGVFSVHCWSYSAIVGQHSAQSMLFKRKTQRS